LKMTMMDAAINTQKPISGYTSALDCEDGSCSCKAGKNCDSRESDRYIQAGTMIPLLILSK